MTLNYFVFKGKLDVIISFCQVKLSLLVIFEYFR